MGARRTRTADVHGRILAVILIPTRPPAATASLCVASLTTSAAHLVPKKPSLVCTVSALWRIALGVQRKLPSIWISLVVSSSTEINLLKIQGLGKSEGKAESGIYREET